MEQLNTIQAIEDFMHPTVYTGVKPIFIVGEELVTDTGVGHVCEAVWVGINSREEFTYISKFAVSGKIIFGKYYQPSEMEPFKGRLAFVNEKNLKNVILHKHIVKQIKELELKRYKLHDAIQTDFNNLKDLHLQNKEIYLFQNKNGQWDKELFSDCNINTPYKLISVEKKDTELHLELKKTKVQKIQKFLNRDKFYGYFLGSLADLAGLKLRNESYLAGITSLQDDAKTVIKSIQWLDLDDILVQNILKKLPQHPFEDYFHYVKKENVRKIDVDPKLLDTLKKIILKHIPENGTPLGMEYIAIDKLLFLFHMIITREEALLALQICDIVYETPAIVLGYQGKHQLPPKYLVPITHVADAYKQLPNFMSVCKNFNATQKN